MKLRCLPTFLAVVTLMLPSAVFGQKVVTDATTTSGDAHGYVSPWQKLEACAKQENPADANSVRALIAEILDFPSYLGHMPPVMRELVEQRLEQAEMSYRFGRRPGIQEGDLVTLFDKLAEKLGLPDSARTTPHQIELLRFEMEMSMPTFMGPAFPERTQSTASPGAGELSPAQATHILFVLAQQKIMNPDYQLAPDEWEKTRYEPALDRLVKYKELRDSGQLGKGAKAEVRAIPIPDDWRRTISKKISEMSIMDGLDLVEEAFKMEGIK